MDILFLILIVLALAFTGTGLYVGRPGYRGVGAGLGTILYAIAAIVVVVVVLRLLGVI